MTTATIDQETVGTGTEPAGVREAQAALESARATQAEWEGKAASIQAELDLVEVQAGEALVEDPSAERDLAKHVDTLTTRLRLVQKAAVAHQVRVTAAEAAYLTAEADRLEESLRGADAEIADHEAKTERLLAALVEHEGNYVPEIKYINLVRSVDPNNGPTSWKVPKSQKLRSGMVLRRRQVRVLRELAAGADPEPLLKEWRVGRGIYPDCVMGSNALVPAPAWLKTVAHARQQLAELEQARAALPEEIRAHEQGLAKRAATPFPELEQRLKEQAVDGESPLPELARKRARLATIDEDLEAARAQVAALAPFPTHVTD